MAQTPVIREVKNDQLTVDYDAAADKTAGDVIEIGSVPMVLCRDIDYSENPRGALAVGNGEVWLMPQVAGVITAGDAVYWDNNGSPYGGTALSGCATGTASGNYLVGTAAPLQPNGTNATTATDSYVRVIPNAASRTTTIAGSVTADDITGSDSSLAINGKPGSSSAGGAVVGTGGAGAGAGNAGGAWTVTGGAGVAAAGATGGVGGAVTRTGGAGGADTNAGTGGAGGAATAVGGVGGAVTGAGTGGAGGAAGMTGGVGGATSTTGTGGAGGAISSTAGAGGAATGAGTGGVGGASVFTAGAGGSAATTGTGGVGGAAGIVGGVGGAAGAGGTGAAGGAANITAGTGGAAATNGTGGAGGALTVTGGVGGSTATGTGGAGSTITIAAGAGGAASGAGTGGAGGKLVLTAGAGGGTSGGTAGIAGWIECTSLLAKAQGAPTAMTTAATMTISGLMAGIVTGTHSAGATQAYTLPTGTDMSGTLPLANGECFDWSLINLSAAAADTITLTAAADHTIVGNAIVQSAHASTGGVYGNSAVFRSRKTAATTWITYRIA